MWQPFPQENEIQCSNILWANVCIYMCTYVWVWRNDSEILSIFNSLQRTAWNLKQTSGLPKCVPGCLIPILWKEKKKNKIKQPRKRQTEKDPKKRSGYRVEIRLWHWNVKSRCEKPWKLAKVSATVSWASHWHNWPSILCYKIQYQKVLWHRTEVPTKNKVITLQQIKFCT